MTTSAAGEDLARVTVISPTRRIDLALPGGTTLGDLLPDIVRFSGYEGGAGGEAVQAWVLQRFGEDPLDPQRPIAELNIRDGETLHLRQRESAIPDASFDDVVDAVATSTSTQPAWRPQDGQRFALGVVTALAVLVPGFAVLTSPSPVLVALAVLALSLAIGFVAILVSRAFGLRLVAGTLGWVSSALGALGGAYLIRGGFPPRPGDLAIQVLTGAAVLLVLSAAMALGTQVSPYQFLAAALTALGLILTTMAIVLLPTRTVQVCAVALALDLALTPLLPSLSFRVAQVAMPNLPSSAEALMADRTPVQSDIVARAIAADRFLAAFLTATSMTAILLGFPVALGDDGWAATALVGAAGVALALRARAFVGRTQRFVLLLAGTVLGLLAIFEWLSALPAGPIRIVIGLLVVVVGVWVLTQYASTMYRKILSPVWGRWGDIVEWLAIMAIAPLTLAVLDLYAWAYGLAG